MKAALPGALFAALLCPVTPCAELTTVVGVKLIKAKPGPSTDFKIRLPADCTGCTVLTDAIYTGQNAREIFFHLRVPVAKPLLRDIVVELSATDVSAVIVEKNRLRFAKSATGVAFDVPVVPRSRSSTVEVQTSLESPSAWPAVVVRVEHAFPDRRGGRYATGTWPAVQRQAALNLEFGLREALRDLGVDREVAAHNLGKIHLMGFDTNNPLGHEDYPPHIHIILRWPHFAGSQAPHLYISNDGLLLPDATVTIDGMPHIAATRIPGGTWIPAIDYLGATAFATKITETGGIVLRRSESQSCELVPLRQAQDGFASGTHVTCTSGGEYRVRAEDDVEHGELRVEIAGKRTELYRYDVDTAVLLSADPPLK